MLSNQVKQSIRNLIGCVNQAKIKSVEGSWETYFTSFNIPVEKQLEEFNNVIKQRIQNYKFVER